MFNKQTCNGLNNRTVNNRCFSSAELSVCIFFVGLVLTPINTQTFTHNYGAQVGTTLAG